MRMQPHLLEVAVVGDFKIDELKTVVKKYIGQSQDRKFLILPRS